MSLDKNLKQKIVFKYGKNKNNSGITEVQIALITEQINYLKHHFSKHTKDFCSKRGLLNMVSKRRKLLNYLKFRNISRYNTLIENLKLRR